MVFSKLKSFKSCSKTVEQQINVLESQNCNKNFCTENMFKTDKMRKSDTFSRKYGYLKCVSFKHTTVH